MNESVSLRRGGLLVLLLTLLLGGCGQAAPAEDPPLKGARLGGAFSLTDQNGRRVTERSWPGKYRLVYFGYTFCPDVCPVDMRVLGAGLRQVRGAGSGPRGPRPADLRQRRSGSATRRRCCANIVANFHPRLVGLTGTPDELARMARAYGGYFQRQRGRDPRRLSDGPQPQCGALRSRRRSRWRSSPMTRAPQGAADELARWVR